MKKGIITNVKIERIFGMGYTGEISFRIGDNYYSSTRLEDFMKNYQNKYHNISEIEGSDFRVLGQFRVGEEDVFEVELINDTFNAKKNMSYLYVEEK